MLNAKLGALNKGKEAGAISWGGLGGSGAG